MKGRQIRTGAYTQPEEGVPVDMGDVLFVRSDRHETEPSTKDAILVDTHEFMRAVRPGDLVAFEDGTLNAIVIEVDESQVKVQFKDAGLITSCNSVRIPSARLATMPLLRVSDKETLQDIAIPQKFDYVSVPCVTSVKDIQECKYSLGRDEYAARVGVLARIDNVEAVHQFEGILKYVDGVVIVRNELSFELPPEKLMIAQKWMIQTANMLGIPVFIQSQILPSMVSHEEQGATRQETTDISTAVVDGADVFILTHETSVGSYGFEAAVLLSKAIAEAEQIFDHEKAYEDARKATEQKGKDAGATEILCSTASQIALTNNVDLYICLTQTGKITAQLARQRPMQQIVACSEFSSVVRQMNMMRGVVGYKIPTFLKKHSDRLIELILKVCQE